MNPLSEMPRTRKITYRIYWLVGVLLGGTQLALFLAGVAQDVITIILNVYVYLGVALGFQADQNTNANTYDPKHD